MKNFILISLLLFITTACSTDNSNDDNPQIQASIVGKWQLEALVNGNENQHLDNCERLNTFEFFENGTTFQQDYYKGTGGECFEQSPVSAEYSVSENTLKLTYEYQDGSMTYEETISELTQDKLILLVDKRYNGPVEGEIFTVTYKRVN